MTARQKEGRSVSLGSPAGEAAASLMMRCCCCVRHAAGAMANKRSLVAKMLSERKSMAPMRARRRGLLW